MNADEATLISSIDACSSASSAAAFSPDGSHGSPRDRDGNPEEDPTEVLLGPVYVPYTPGISPVRAQARSEAKD